VITATPETEKPRQPSDMDKITKPSDMDMDPKNVVKPEDIANPSSQLIVSNNVVYNNIVY